MTPTQSPTLASQATAELPSEERERILKAAALAMPFTNPLIWQDWREGHTVHTEADDIVAIWQAAEAAGRASRAQSEWISVEDRVPTEWTSAWIANFDNVQQAIFDHVDRKFLVEDAYGAYEEAYGVTHWMPFIVPTPPATLGETK